MHVRRLLANSHACSCSHDVYIYVWTSSVVIWVTIHLVSHFTLYHYKLLKQLSYTTYRSNHTFLELNLTAFHGTILPYFGKRKQVTYHPNLSYWCFHSSPNVLYFQAKFYAETLILLRDMLGKTSWYSIDISVNDRHILLFYEKCHFCHLLPFAKVGQYRVLGAPLLQCVKFKIHDSSLIRLISKWCNIVNVRRFCYDPEARGSIREAEHRVNVIHVAG